MALDVTTLVEGEVAEITLAGELDAATAPQFQRALESVAAQRPHRLVLRLADLTYLASAGVRMLIFVRQKMPRGVEVILVAPQEMVLETLQRTGVTYAFVVSERYPVAV